MAQRCGDLQGAARALLTLLEEARNEMDDKEVLVVAEQLQRLLASLPQSPIGIKVEIIIKEITTLRAESD